MNVRRIEGAKGASCARPPCPLPVPAGAAHLPREGEPLSVVPPPSLPLEAPPAGHMARDNSPPKRDGIPSKMCYTVELCAGTAGFTASLARAGFEALAIDHRFNRHAAKVPCITLDLALRSSWAVLEDLLATGRLVYVHGAPPCGTASRSRDKPVPAAQLRAGAPDVRPVRSEDCPCGLPGLAGIEKKR